MDCGQLLQAYELYCQMTGVEQAFDTRIFEGNVSGLRWFTNNISPNGLFPQYYKHVGEERVAIPAAKVPAKTKLPTQEFKRAVPGNPYTLPATGAGPDSFSFLPCCKACIPPANPFATRSGCRRAVRRPW